MWAALILLHPTLLLYSRTIMADLTAALCVTAGFFWSDARRTHPFLAGIALGVCPVVRTATLPLAGVLGLAMAWRLWRSGQTHQLAAAGAGAAIPLILLGTYNQLIFGDPLATNAAATGYFEWGTSPGRALFYLVALNLVWPLLATAIVATRHPRRVEAQLLLGISIVLFSGYYFVDRRFGLPADFVVGLRFFVPILPILVIVYVERLAVWAARIPLRNAALAGALAAVLVGDAGLVLRHQRFLGESAARREVAVAAAQGWERVIVHGSVAELMSTAWGAPPVLLAGSVAQMVEAARSDARRTLLLAQGPAGDSLVAAELGVARQESGLTIVTVEPATSPGRP